MILLNMVEEDRNDSFVSLQGNPKLKALNPEQIPISKCKTVIL